MANATTKESSPSEPLSVTTDPTPEHLVTYYANDGDETPTIINSVQEGTTFQLIAADSFTPPRIIFFVRFCLGNFQLKTSSGFDFYPKINWK